tara:strand:+ start:540 stop:743 length:204 start_codon:yes stop_codon:yes gene_type:complete
MKKIKPKTNQYLKIIDKIEKTRTVNNINWMNILRIAIISNPKKTINVMKKINLKDKKISYLLNKLVE